MDQLKKNLKIKTSSLKRLSKELECYKVQISKYVNLDGASEEAIKKQKAFQSESVQAMEAVKSSLIKYRQNLQEYLVDKKDELDIYAADLQEEIDSAKQTINSSIAIVPEPTA